MAKFPGPKILLSSSFMMNIFPMNTTHVQKIKLNIKEVTKMSFE
jgi:hypothetical protein